MTTTTKVFSGEYGYATFTFAFSNVNSDLKVTGQSFSIDNFIPTVTEKINFNNYLSDGYAELAFNIKIGAGDASHLNYSTNGSIPWTNGATKTITRQTQSLGTVPTSAYFNSSNKTERSLLITYTSPYTRTEASTTNGYTDHKFIDYTTPYSFNLSQTVTLDIPPTFNEAFSYTNDFSGVPYAGLTTANVQLSSLSAKYGGDFSGVGNAEFIIGSQSVSKPNPANNDVLSISLNSVGTFTPTIKVTDSRGQVTTHTLPAITVMGYNAPTVSFNASRTTSAGVPDDEGAYGFLEATLNFTDAIADAVAPSVVMTEDDGTQTTPTVSWYTDNTLTTPVTWSSLSSGATVYGIFSGLSTQHSYTVSVRPRDSEGTGIAVTQTIGAAFYTVDFLAGGHGIAFGKPASNVGFECAMEATFEDTLQADGTATFGADVLIDLPEYQTASTTDKAIYDAVVALGWDSDVLIS